MKSLRRKRAKLKIGKLYSYGYISPDFSSREDFYITMTNIIGSKDGSNRIILQDEPFLVLEKIETNSYVRTKLLTGKGIVGWIWFYLDTHILKEIQHG